MDTNFEKQPPKPLNEQVEQTHRATQKELAQSLVDGLRDRLSVVDIECVQDKEYLRLKRSNKQIGIVFKMPDGNRTVVRFDSDLETIIEEFESSIQPESIFVTNRSKDSTDFIFFPNLTEEEAAVLQARIEPVAGHIVIVQGEYVIASKQDNVHQISIFGISSCRGVIIYDPEKGIAAVTHSDMEYTDIPLIQQMRTDLIKAGADPAKLKLYGTPNIDSQKRQHVIDKLFSETIYGLPSEFTFDCATGSVTPFSIKSLPQSENLGKRLKDEVDFRLKHHIPYIRKEIKEFAAEVKI